MGEGVCVMESKQSSLCPLPPFPSRLSFERVTRYHSTAAQSPRATHALTCISSLQSITCRDTVVVIDLSIFQIYEKCQKKVRKQTSPEGECQPGPEKFEGEEGEDTVDRLVDQSIQRLMYVLMEIIELTLDPRLTMPN